jgi:hypothetical protein
VTPTPHATYRWTTERDPTTGLNRVRRVQGPDPRTVLASYVPPPPPPPKEPYHFRPDDDDAQEVPLERTRQHPPQNRSSPGARSKASPRPHSPSLPVPHEGRWLWLRAELVQQKPRGAS